MTETTLRKRRGVTRASLTRLGTRLRDLEGKTDQATTLDLAQQLQQKLEKVDSDFKTHHYDLIDVVDDEEILSREQDTLDAHDDEVSILAVRIRHLIAACSSSSESNPRKVAMRRLLRLRKGLSSIREATGSLTEESDSICLLHQYEEQIADFKKELGDIRSSLLSLDLEEADDLCTNQAEVEKGIFDCSLTVKKLLRSQTHVSTVSDGGGVKLPKLDVPTFDGNLVNWRSFWEQFSISVHNRPRLSDSEKLVYLQGALKGGSAKNTIEGLSRSGEFYTEAIECLQSRYNRPRLIHQTHVRMIIDAPPLKEGNGRELRRLHDTVQQHLRALKAMEYEPSGPFITSVLELKLDADTMFEWQRHSQEATVVPHFQKLLEFIDLRAQASETSVPDQSRRPRSEVSSTKGSKAIASYAGTADSVPNCVICNSGNHPLYTCTRFKSFPHDKMLSALRSNNLCINCLRPGHFTRQCQSLNRCKRCQKPHHTLLHLESKDDSRTPPSNPPTIPVSAHAAMGLQSNFLLMTCRVLVEAPDGSSMEARALLDSASSASFVSERLAQSLRLPRSNQSTSISGVAGLVRNSSLQSIADFHVSPVHAPGQKIGVTAVIVPRVTCDLPLHPVPFDLNWNHLSDVHLADPGFGHPSKVDVLLGVEVFVEVMLQGRRTGPPGTPIAFETQFGWVLAGSTHSCAPTHHVVAHHVTLLSGDDLLRKFWEIEEKPIMVDTILSPEERAVVHHFRTQHSRTSSGRFVVPLPRKPEASPLGESRSQAVRRFLSLERSLHSKGQFREFEVVMREYFDMGHAERVPEIDLEKSQQDVFYLPIHAVRKESSSTTKVRAVFDASAQSSTGASLNDTLLVGPTVHPPLIDVLLRFRFHRVALTTDVSKMYRAVELTQSDRDLHRFVWRGDPKDPLQDCRMTRVTFGVSASSFIANMSVKQNSRDFALEYPLATKVVDDSFYVDDGLTGADSVGEAVRLQNQLQDLFGKAGFLLRKWDSSDPRVLQHIPTELRDSRSTHNIPDPEEYTKTLGIEWNTGLDHFRLTVSELPPPEDLTKRVLVSDIAKTYDVLGWFSPSIIKVKILLQRLWEQKVDWDDPVPLPIRDSWLQWRTELKLLSKQHIQRCYYPKDAHIASVQLHGFSDASEQAYAGVVYLRMTDSNGDVHVSLVMSKTKVAPLKRLTIPRLELCGAHLLAQLVSHAKEVFHIPLQSVYAWTDSTIVLNWLTGSPRRFKTYVGNRVSLTMELVAPDRWNHVKGLDNPADCASRGLFPSELLEHNLWWKGPDWLRLDATEWPKSATLPPNNPADERDEVCLHTTVLPIQPIIPFDRYSTFTRFKRVTAWIFRFIHNCRRDGLTRVAGPLSVKELQQAETHFVLTSQESCFASEVKAIRGKHEIHHSSCLLPLHPFLDNTGLLRVGGREQNSKLPYNSQHPIVLHGKHPLTRLIIRSEHLRLLHAGPTLLTSMLCRRFHIIGFRKIVRTVTRGCFTCRRNSSRPQPQLLGQLPMERVTPDAVFDKVGVDYAGPVYIKYGYVRKPTIVKAYICVFVSLSVKATHLELVSDLTTEAFIASLRRFVARRGKPSLIWSDHGTNFVGAARELQELVKFLSQQKIQGTIADFCSSQNIKWDFIPEHAPHFGGLWESAVKSLKTHLRRVVGAVKLTFEEFTTVLTQIEACLNSRPLVPLPCDDDGVEALTPGHFLIGRQLDSLPDPSFSYRSFSLLRRWHLCQALVRHFWKRWSTEYLSSLQKYSKWHRPSRNISVGDVVILREDGMTPAKWPLARIVRVHAGKDGIVRVVSARTPVGTYTRPVTKVALLLPCEL